jgi:flagellar assembly factor FliW
MTMITTSRFGPVDVDEKRAVHFPDGLLGFAGQKDYIVLDHKPGSAFCWLQSRELPGLAFVLTNPYLIDADYLSGLGPEEKTMVFGANAEPLAIFVLVTIPPGQIEQITANLQGPLIINTRSRTGRQLVLANSGYSHCHPLLLKG